MAEPAIRCALVVAGEFHDIDFARLELLKLLSETPSIRTRLFESYEALTALEDLDMLVSYTCNVAADAQTSAWLRSYLERGGRWFALHGTNSVLEFLSDGRVSSPDSAAEFMDLLGSRFIAHPPVGPYQVDIADPDDPLVQGIEPFETNDELYLMEHAPGIEVLLDVGFEGEAPGFEHDQWAHARHPVLYRHKVGAGEVLYLTLGHARGHWDMKPLMDYYPQIERSSWELPVYYELLRRGLNWAAQA